MGATVNGKDGFLLVDTRSVFLNEDGSFKAENWHADGTHMSEQGYEALQAIITTLFNINRLKMI